MSTNNPVTGTAAESYLGTSRTDRGDASEQTGIVKALVVGVSLWILGNAILLYHHFSHTLVKPHYQYVLLLPPLVAFLLWQRSDAERLRFGRPSRWWAVLWVIPLVMLAAASWLFSPWIAMAALVLLGPITCVAVGGFPLWKTTWGVWMLTAFLLPLPLRMDERLIVALRDLATRVTSRILDYFGVLHMISGNVVELPEKKLFVADACSGIHSLFVLMAVAATVSVWNYRGPIATTLLLIVSFGLVMVENVLRLFTVSMSIRVGYDLSEGVGHQILGFVLFAFSLSMILSFDQWIAFWSIPRRSKMHSSSAGKGVSVRLTPFVGMGIVSCFLLPIQWLKMPDEIPSLTGGFTADIEITELGKEFLPAERNGFTLLEFEKIVRVQDDPFGHYSQVWRYAGGTTEVVFSLNYSYRAIHDACLCYRNTGWNVGGETVMGVQDDGQTVFQSGRRPDWGKTPVLAATMSHPLEGDAVLFYSMLSESGKSGIVIDSRKQGTSTGQALGRFQMMETSVPEQWIQLQMVAMQPGGLADEEKSSLEAWFREVQAKLFQRCLDDLSE